MQTYILVDTANMFMRARHVVRGDDMYTKIGMSYHIMFNSINKVWREQKGTHVVIALEGLSWRKDFYEPTNVIGRLLLPPRQNVNKKKTQTVLGRPNELQDSLGIRQTVLYYNMVSVKLMTLLHVGYINPMITPTLL